MGKTWATVTLVLLAVGPAVWARDGAIRRVTTTRQDTFGSGYLPPAQSQSPAASPAATGSPATPPATTAPAAGSAAAAPVPCMNGTCYTPPEHVPCWRRLCKWLSYCPLKYGVNCDLCSNDGHGDCCCYHCFPPIYLFMIQPCVDGQAPKMPCSTCGCHGGGNGGNGDNRGGPLGDSGTISAQRNAGKQGQDTAPQQRKTFPDSDSGTQPTQPTSPAQPNGESRGIFGQRHRLFSLSTGFGCGSVGCR
jgi:hypothetical protein